MRGALICLLAAVFGIGIVLPMGHLVAASLADGHSGFTVRYYLEVLSSRYLTGALMATAAFCAATAAIGTVAALPAAWWIARNRRGARVLRALCQVNFAFTGVVYGMLVLTLLGNSGVLALLEGMAFGTEFTRGVVYTTIGLAIGYLGFQVPRAAILLAQAMERLEPEILSAARVLGASPWQQALLVVLPQLRRPLLTTFLALMLMSMASFGTALLVARTIEIFPVLIFREFVGFGEINRAAAMGVILAVCCLALEAGARWIEKDRQTAAGRFFGKGSH